jgi:hypothetical protein
LIWPRRLRSLPTKTRQKVLVFREADPLPHYAGCFFSPRRPLIIFNDFRATDFTTPGPT